jgi:hypothetical protein
MAKRRKDFLTRAKEKGVDRDTGIVNGKLKKKKLEPETEKKYQAQLDKWDL